MKTAPRLDDELGEALRAYADRIPATPDHARLLAAIEAGPSAAFPVRRSHSRVAGMAAGLALLMGAGGVAWAMSGGSGDEDPVVKVTAVEPATTTTPTTAAATTLPLTTLPPTTLPPTTLPPTTLPPAPVQAAPPAVAPAAPQTAAARPAATTVPRKRSTPVTTVQQPQNPPPPATPPAASVGFSASAAFGSCADDPPFDVYSGSANPGSTVTISSPFGGGTARADEHGYWEETVHFQGAPLNETFSVTVSSAQGSATFDFTHTG